MSRLPRRQPARALTVVVIYLLASALALAVGHAAKGSIGLVLGLMAVCAGLLAVALLAPLPQGPSDDPEQRPVLRRG